MIIGACYIRVSTDDQTEYSPEAQLNAIKDYCKKNNIILPQEYIFKDEGISGRRADKRPGFQQMIKTAKKKPKPFDVILVHKFDRFARSREDSIVYKSLLKRECDIKVISITETIEDDKFGVILEGMLESMAEYYSLNLSDEVKKGMIERAKKGGINTTAPFGYINKNKTLVQDEEKANIVRMIFHKFLYENMGYREIATYLNDLGIKTNRGNKWENRIVKYLLQNPVYCGYTRWSNFKQYAFNYNNDKSIIVKSDFEPIIDEDTFNKAQEKLKIKEKIHRKYAKNTQKKHWLSNLIKCSNCGKTLTRSRGDYFQCCGYSKGTCNTSQSIKIVILEEVVLNHLKEIYTEKLDINYSNDVETNNNELQLLKKQLEKINDKEYRIKEAYRNGIDTLEEYKYNKIEVQKEKETILANIEKISNTDIKKEDTIKYTKTLYELLNDKKVSIDDKYNAIHLLIDKMIFDRDNKTLEIFYRKEITKNN